MPLRTLSRELRPRAAELLNSPAVGPKFDRLLVLDEIRFEKCLLRLEWKPFLGLWYSALGLLYSVVALCTMWRKTSSIHIL
jgi:hypothetical protein